METRTTKPTKSGVKPLIVIVGQTASGKSALAMELAKLHDGVIVCADSRTIYKHADIGTAKPSDADQTAVPHHMLDLIEPSERYSAAQFKETAAQIIEDVQNKNKLPILVGGTGLYIDSILYSYEFLPKAEIAERDRLEKLSVEELTAVLKEKKLALPTNDKNRMHLIRAIETNGAIPIKSKIRADAIVVGIEVDKAELKQRITKRVDYMFNNGLVEETMALGKKYGWDAPGLQSTSYRAVREHIKGSLPLNLTKHNFIRNDLALAKRQKTWFKRNPSIQWYSNSGEIVDFVTTTLNKTV